MDRDKLIKYNLIMMIAEGALFWAGLAFIESTTVVSLFIDWQTGSTALVGLAQSMRSVAFLLGQLVVGSFITGLKNQRDFMIKVGFIGRPLLIFMVIALALGVNGPIAVYLLIILVSLWFFTDGLVGLCWIEILIRTIPHESRGKILGYTQAISGAIGIITGFVLRAIFASGLTRHGQFTLIFTLATIVMTINAFFLAKIKDMPEEDNPPERTEISVKASLDYFKRLVPLAGRSRPFRRLTLARGFYALIAMAAPLYILQAESLPGISEQIASFMFFMPVIGQMFGGIFWARMSEKIGYVPVMYGSVINGVLIGSVAICSLLMRGNAALICLMLALMLTSANNSAYMGYFNHLITQVSESARTSYIVLTGVFMAPLSFGATIAGIVCAQFGFAPVYAMVVLAGLCGIFTIIDSRRKGII